MPLSDKIVTQARTWLGTKYHHQGRLKKSSNHNGGVDCLGLIIGVLNELQIKDSNGKLLSEYDEINYSNLPDGKRLKAKLNNYLKEIPKQNIKLGDIALLRFANNPQHTAFIGEIEGQLTLIHCYLSSGKVVEHRINENWRKRIVAIYRIK